MQFKVKCVNDVKLARQNGKKLQYGVVYNVAKLIGENREFWGALTPRVELKEFPGVYYLPKRFAVIQPREIVIT